MDLGWIAAAAAVAHHGARGCTRTTKMASRGPATTTTSSHLLTTRRDDDPESELDADVLIIPDLELDAAVNLELVPFLRLLDLNPSSSSRGISTSAINTEDTNESGGQNLRECFKSRVGFRRNSLLRQWTAHCPVYLHASGQPLQSVEILCCASKDALPTRGSDESSQQAPPRVQVLSKEKWKTELRKEF